MYLRNISSFMSKGNSSYIAVHYTPLNAYEMFFDFFHKCVTCSSSIVTISTSQTSVMPNDSVGAGSANLYKNVYVYE